MEGYGVLASNGLQNTQRNKLNTNGGQKWKGQGIRLGPVLVPRPRPKIG
jgi:hypothetical protein